MYSLVLMAALTTGGTAPDFFHKNAAVCGSCTACYGCTGCSGCYGCTGCCGGMPVPVVGCTGCYGCTGGYAVLPTYGGCTGLGYGHGYGYYGTCDGGCWGVGNSWLNNVPALPPLPAPKAEDDTTKPEQLTEPPQEKTPEQLQDPMMKDKEVTLEPNRARVVVALPADARLFIDDRPTRATSSVRSFRTPELRDGETYYYILRAEIEVDGKPVSLTKRLVLRPGEVVHARFDDPRAVVVTGRR